MPIATSTATLAAALSTAAPTSISPLLTPAFIIAQIIGAVMVIITIIGTQSKQQKHMLAAYTVQNFLEVVQFLVLGAFTGVGTSLLAMARSSILYLYKRLNKTPHYVFLLVYSAVAILIGFLTWQNPWSIVPVAATIIYTFGFWQSRPLVSRLCIIIVALGMCVYTFSQGGWIGAISSFIELTSAIIALIRHDLTLDRKRSATSHQLCK